MYIRLKSRLGYEITVEEAKKIATAIDKDAKFFGLRGNMIATTEVAGLFQDGVGKDFVAKDRGLHNHNGEYLTADELLGRSPVLPKLPEAPAKVSEYKELT